MQPRLLAACGRRKEGGEKPAAFAGKIMALHGTHKRNRKKRAGSAIFSAHKEKKRLTACTHYAIISACVGMSHGICHTVRRDLL